MDDGHPRGISLIICTQGEPERLASTIRRASAALDASTGLIEVILVDNSRHGLERGIDDSRIRIVRCTLPGLSRARTAGSLHARGQVLVYTDDDVLFGPHWPSIIARPILDGDLDAAAAPVRLSPRFDSVRSRVRREWLAEGNLGDEVRLIGAGMAISRDVLGYGLWDQQIGAGHPDFAFGEETLFEAMIREAGARVGVVKAAEVVHDPDERRLRPDEWGRTARRKAWSDVYVGYHWRGDVLRLVVPRVIVRRLRLAAHRASSGRSDEWSERDLVLVQSLEQARAYRWLSKWPRAYANRAVQAALPARASKEDA